MTVTIATSDRGVWSADPPGIRGLSSIPGGSIQCRRLIFRSFSVSLII